jgi:hypothetical protein
VCKGLQPKGKEERLSKCFGVPEKTRRPPSKWNRRASYAHMPLTPRRMLLLIGRHHTDLLQKTKQIFL